MKRSIIPIFAVLVLLFQNLPAQQHQDIIFLKDGSVVWGTIFEYVPGKSVTLRTVDNLVTTYTYEEIERIRTEGLPPSAPAYSDKVSNPYHYVNVFQLGVLDRNGQRLSTFSLLHGVRPSEHQSYALGIGWDSYGSTRMIPLYVNFKAYSLAVDASPYAFVDVGYSLGKLQERAKWDAGGFLADAGVGLMATTPWSVMLVMQVSYRYQRMTSYEPNQSLRLWDYLPIYGMEYQRVNREFVMFTLGVAF